MNKTLALVGMGAFVVFQLGLSLSSTNIYPFNSYQMFSNNWKSGQVIAGIEVSYDGAPPRPVFEQVNIPFFQANKIFLSGYYDVKNPQFKQVLCSKLLAGAEARSVEIFGVMKKFVRSQSGDISTSYDFKEKVFTCGI